MSATSGAGSHKGWTVSGPVDLAVFGGTAAVAFVLVALAPRRCGTPQTVSDTMAEADRRGVGDVAGRGLRARRDLEAWR